MVSVTVSVMTKWIAIAQCCQIGKTSQPRQAGVGTARQPFKHGCNRKKFCLLIWQHRHSSIISYLVFSYCFRYTANLFFREPGPLRRSRPRPCLLDRLPPTVLDGGLGPQPATTKGARFGEAVAGTAGPPLPASRAASLWRGWRAPRRASPIYLLLLGRCLPSPEPRVRCGGTPRRRKGRRKEGWKWGGGSTQRGAVINTPYGACNAERGTRQSGGDVLIKTPLLKFSKEKNGNAPILHRLSPFEFACD